MKLSPGLVVVVIIVNANEVIARVTAKLVITVWVATFFDLWRGIPSWKSNSSTGSLELLMRLSLTFLYEAMARRLNQWFLPSDWVQSLVAKEPTPRPDLKTKPELTPKPDLKPSADLTPRSDLTPRLNAETQF